jgi:hypothetical protein
MMRSPVTRLDGDRPVCLAIRAPLAILRLVRIALLLACLVACGAPQRARPTTGAIAGLARDHDSGDPIAKAEIRVHAAASAHQLTTTSSDLGLYDVDHLAPGRYHLSAAFAGQPLEVANIDVRAGETTMVDLTFTLGRPDPIRVDFGDPRAGAIDRYRPRGAGTTAAGAIIEGTVNDTTTRLRVPGAVITAVGTDIAKTQQTISDDHGRYRFDAMPPGIYSVSAYYSLGGRGQIEVRRSGINVDAAEAVVVPLWIETAR